ncbi:hypothetical protein JB92DRAFT_696111 [Gautieria morchelliformis]|nr:hypothetical protein JB92DRAFT_696111 [Gautieria morchelliformis]
MARIVKPGSERAQGSNIDTFEVSTKLPITMQMALHTEHVHTSSSSPRPSVLNLYHLTRGQPGLVNLTDCSFQANSNQGCVVTPQDAELRRGLRGCRRWGLVDRIYRVASPSRTTPPKGAP